MVKVRIITEKGYETNGQTCGEIEIKSPFLCSESMSVPGTMHFCPENAILYGYKAVNFDADRRNAE